jgi:menaquinone-dependent protoporphyrinogen oxidase
MLVKVLVVWSSKHGATRGIADRIAARLHVRGIACVVLDVEAVNDVSGYDAVVLGSAVYFGAWRKDATRFAQRNRAALAALPVWLFSSGPLAEQSVDDLVPVAELGITIGARDHRVFAGALDAGKLSIPEKIVMVAVKSRAKDRSNVTGDFRDWHEIDTWADGIAEALLKVPVGVR